MVICPLEESGCQKAKAAPKGRGDSAIGEVHGDFKANAQIGVGGFGPHGAFLMFVIVMS